MFPVVLSVCGMSTALLLNIPTENLLGWILSFPLLGALGLALLPFSRAVVYKVWALFFTLLTLGCCMRLWASFQPLAPEPFQAIVGVYAGWKSVLNFHLFFGVDGLSLWMVLLTAALMPLAILCGWSGTQTGSKAFLALLLVLETALLSAFTCLDLLGFYVLYESALLPMFLLIGLGGQRERKVRAAYLLVLYTLVGSLALLPAVLLALSGAGSTSLLALVHTGWAPARQLVLWWGFFLAFAVKIPVIPLHLWLPEAHVEASTAGSVLLAGVLLKLGTYGLLRFCLPLWPIASAYYGPIALTIALIGVVYASLTTLRQVDLKKLVAYSSIAHMNMGLLAILTLGDLGAIGASFLMLAHGVASPALFLCVGALYDRAHTKALKYLGGAATAMPLFSLALFIASLCNLALPLTPNFVAEFLCLCSLWGHNLTVLVGALIGVILSAAYTLWAYARVVHGMPKTTFFNAMADLNRRETWTLLPLGLLTIWWGLKPEIVLNDLSAGLWFWQQSAQKALSVYPWIYSKNFFLDQQHQKAFSICFSYTEHCPFKKILDSFLNKNQNILDKIYNVNSRV